MIERRPHPFFDRFGGDIAFAVVAVAAVTVRWHALARAGAPPGFDGGDWLALGRGLFGTNVRPHGIVAAPLIPLLTVTSVAVVGRTSFVALGAVLSVAPALGAYWVLRNLVHVWAAVMFASLLVGVAAVGEAAAWGGYPQLLGLGLLPPALLLVDRALSDGRGGRAVGAGVGLLLVALTSDFVFVVAATAAALLVVFQLAVAARTRSRSYSGIVKTSVLIASPLVLAAPLYARLLSTRVSAVTRPARLLGESAPGLRQRLDALWSDRPQVWWVLFVAALAALLFSRRRLADAHWRIALVLLASVSVFVLVFPEPRLAYFAPSAIVIAAALWAKSVAGESAGARPFFVGALAVGLIVQVAAVPHTASIQARRYQALTPGLVAGIDWLRNQTPRGATIVVTPYRDAPPVGWWVEGLGERRTFSASSPEWVYFDSERTTAARAARVLSAGVPTPVTLALARRFGADFVLIDKRWSDYVPARVISLERRIPGVVVFDNRSVVILRTSPE